MFTLPSQVGKHYWYTKTKFSCKQFNKIIYFIIKVYKSAEKQNKLDTP